MLKRIVIVGGVAAGANAAVRARRLSESASITIFERGPFVSFANCGLPYYVGGEIEDRNKLTVQTPASLTERFGLTVHVLHEVIKVFPDLKEIEVRDLVKGETHRVQYDELILATGAAPLKPSIPGIDSPLLFTVRDIPDVDRIKESMAAKKWKRVVVLGGGYIGLEMIEQLHRIGAEVTLIQSLPQVMQQIDPELAALIHDELRAHGVKLILGDAVESIEKHENGCALTVVTKSGAREEADVGIIALGVRPETTLAANAGIRLGDRGGIKVDDQLRTSHPNIWAAGDCIEVQDWITRAWSLIALAGPANRQGRTVANNIFGKEDRYDGTLGTAVIRVFRLTVACTGANERSLTRAGIRYQAVHLHPNSHAGYYPGAKPIALKVLFSPDNGKLLGAQAVGEDGVERRIDIIATAIKGGLTAPDLVDLELCYAPPYGSAKDPVNVAGMIAENMLSGDVSSLTWNTIPKDAFLLDVRDGTEVAKGKIPSSVNIPLNEVRDRLNEIPKDREIVAYCQSGQRSYYACRILTLNGFRCHNLSGAYKTWAAGTAE